MELLLGADPELFLTNKHGKFISSVGLIGGSKRHPKDIGKDCSVQEDNVAAEFNIPPAADADAFVASCQYALDYLVRLAAEKDLLVSITASKVFDKDQLTSKAAQAFGCDADFNAWTRKMNKKPKAPNLDLRSAGGHIHFGYHKIDMTKLIRWADVKMALPSVLEDDDKDRRLLYGQAGCFRPKPYGAEYRTLSNYWLKDEQLMRLVFSRAQETVALAKKGQMLSDNAGKIIQRAINTSDKALAEQLIAKYA